MSVRRREKQSAEQRTLEALRSRIASGLHSGQLTAGDRLPSYRTIARETGHDLRAVARIVRALETDGLVELRDKQGIFVASQKRICDQVLAETGRWMAGVLCDAWQRRISLPGFSAFVRDLTAMRPIRCACIESTVDQLVTLSRELKRDFGLETTAVHAGTLLAAANGSSTLPPAILNADLLVSTLFQAAALRAFACDLRKPLVTVRLDPEVVQAFERQLEAGDLTVICVDPHFIERVTLVVQPRSAERVRGILASDRMAIARIDRTHPVLITRAAHERLQAVALPPDLLPQDRPVLSLQTASELIEIVLCLNSQAVQESEVAAGLDPVTPRIENTPVMQFGVMGT